MFISGRQNAFGGEHEYYHDAVIAVDDSIKIHNSETDSNNNDSTAFAEMPWYKQLLINGFQIHDPRINYPKFPRFCLKVYDWGDRTFNSYNPEYVISTHKNWKLFAKNYNWMESYTMLFPNNQTLHLRSDIYCDIGAYISFMAVSLGYTAKLNNMFGSGESTRSNFQFSFQTSLFTANIDITKSHGGTKILKFGKRNDFPSQLGDARLSSLSGDAYYYFNHWKYSQAAAYCFSKYQLKSSGSPILGFAFNHQNINLSFDDIPESIRNELPALQSYYHFKYTDYSILGGYAYNWVPRPKTWLVNITILPSVGYKHAYKGSSDGLPHMVSTNLRGSFSVVYNHRALFVALMGKADLHFYFAKNYTFFNSIESLSCNVGMRF
jgi:hypothetical protein